jgi:uncharacterized Zn-binding protein involved in type VI secretion
MPPAARITDNHVCPMVTGVVPHVGGPIIPPCEPTVLIGYLPAARITDKCICTGPPDVILKGSPTVLIGYLQAARIGDPTVHGGVIVTGEPTVIIGDGGAGGGAPSSLPIARQKQDGHVGGTPQNSNRIKQGKPTSTFDGDQAEADALTQQAWAQGSPVPGRPNVREFDFGRPIGTGPRGGRQSRVRVHQDADGRIHGHPSGPETS